jgi:hypothetical protein
MWSFTRIGHLGAVVTLGLVAALTSSSAAGAASHKTLPRHGAVGYDVGAQSCGSALPRGGRFAVIAATAGKPFHPSRCLRSEYAWASAMTYRPQYYLNAADPGHKSAHWGKGGPRACHRAPKYDAGCAYDYGVRSAEAALHDVRTAGSTGQGRWWIDVETDNSWGSGRAGIAANVAAISGALHYLRTRPHTSAGVYTETGWWDTITNGARMPHTAVWGGGADTKHRALQNCRAHSITGGRALMVQWFTGTTHVDHDYAC